MGEHGDQSTQLIYADCWSNALQVAYSRSNAYGSNPHIVEREVTTDTTVLAKFRLSAGLEVKGIVTTTYYEVLT